MNTPPKSYPFYLLFIAVVAVACSQSKEKPVQTATHSPVLISETRLSDDAWDDFKWSPDGSLLLLSRWQYQENGDIQPQRVDAPLAIVNADSGELQIIPQSGFGPLWSPDGKVILFTSAGGSAGEERCWVYSPVGKQLSALATFPRTHPWTWLDSGLYYQDSAGLERVQILGLPVNEATSESLAFSKPELQLSFDGSDPALWAFPAPDGKTILFADQRNPTSRRWWLVQSDGRRVKIAPPLYSLGTCCAWSLDGERLAFFGLSPTQGLYIVERNGSDLKRIVSASQMGEGAFLALDFSPDGNWIAFTWTELGEGFPFDRNQIYIVGVDGHGLQQLTVDSSHPHNWLSWSADGRYIASKGKNQDIWLAEVKLP